MLTFNILSYFNNVLNFLTFFGIPKLKLIRQLNNIKYIVNYKIDTCTYGIL